MINRVKLAREVEKKLPKLPKHIAAKLQGWIAGVERFGLDEMRKIHGYRDKPLGGDRAGQWSIRLNLEWRAFYAVQNEQVEFVLVLEVNHHEY